MPLLTDLLHLGLINLHSLQFGQDSEQLKPWLGLNGVKEESAFKDFSDTAHLVRQLDLVISVDTAVAHLSGALNRPTWLLLPQNADLLAERPVGFALVFLHASIPSTSSR